ncbi:DUF1800 domain-containing protein [uncultured Arcticibacterium sp.]|uniref:DUF1800 domain-containing protein n=1 Tax=uncultured Arcticibacterium sp. TaxID=2173042 RepID=UPI0030FBB5A8
MRNIKSFGAQKYAGEFTNAQRKHLLNRTLFGCTVKDLKAFENKNLTQCIDEIIEASPIPSPPVNYYEQKVEDTTGVKKGETWVQAPYGDGTINFWRRQSLRYWWVQQMWFQERTIHEKLVLFWHNHFATQIEVYDRASFAYEYQNTIREQAFGNFKDFVKAITLDKAMLRYLNGRENTKDSPDENYARELQELFTIGIGEGSDYTQDDVRAAARVLTGHTILGVTQNYFFNDNLHDTEDKQFSDFYGNTVISGRSGRDGQYEVDDLLDMIFSKEEVSRFMIRKFYRFFIYYEIGLEVETQFIEPMAKIFRDNNYEIKPLLKAFFSSEHFFDTAFYGAMISSPLDFMVKTLRHLEPPLPSLEENVYQNYSVSGVYMRFAETTQQYIGDPPSVSGWPAYHQTPLYHEIWINSDTYQKRNQSILILLYNEVRRDGYRVVTDVIKYASQFSEPSDPNKLIDDMANDLLSLPLKTELKNKIKTDILLSGQSNDFYWTQLWQNSESIAHNGNFRLPIEERLRALLLYIMSLPEYQLI